MFGITANPANAQYLTADLGGDTTTVKLIRFPRDKFNSPYVMIDTKSAMKLANPKNPGRWVEELQREIKTDNALNHVWSTTPGPGSGALVTEWKLEGQTHYLNLDNVAQAIKDRAPESHKGNAEILQELKREALKDF